MAAAATSTALTSRAISASRSLISKKNLSRVMWEDNDTGWTHFRQDVMAHNRASAALLVHFLKHVNKCCLYAGALEVIDLQRYRFITKPKKVQHALAKRLHLPFVFVVGRN